MALIRNFVRPLAAALALSFAAVPATALADDTAPAQPERKGEARHRKEHGKRGEHLQFPVQAQTFKEHVEKRLQRGRAHLDRAAEKRNVPEAQRALLRKDLDDAAAQIRAAAQRAGADGTVTQDEAQQVRELSKGLKQKAREKYNLRGKKGPKAA
jgi:tellurite resistance protein